MNQSENVSALHAYHKDSTSSKTGIVGHTCISPQITHRPDPSLVVSRRRAVPGPHSVASCDHVKHQAVHRLIVKELPVRVVGARGQTQGEAAFVFPCLLPEEVVVWSTKYKSQIRHSADVSPLLVPTFSQC